MDKVRKICVMAFILSFTFHVLQAQILLFDNGGFITHPGSGPGGKDFSFLTTPLSNYGFGNQVDASQRVSDDFTVTGEGWVIDSIIFFQYQTGSSTTTSFTSTYLQIWEGSSVVWGNLTTNRLKRSAFTGCFRGDNFQNSSRPIMRNTITTPSLSLLPGTYNLDWQAGGTLGSGPWCVPVTISGQLTTGDALGFSQGSWDYLYGDSLGLFKQGLPFLVYGRPLGYPSQITINESYYFWDAYSLESYQIIGLPGMTNFSVSNIMTGNAGENWMAFWDNGQENDYMKSYDATSTFSFKPGNAFWITSDQSIDVVKTIGAVPLNQWETYQIPLNKGGWTLISNPFEENVDWHDILTANGLDYSQLLWDWNGFWIPSWVLETGKGYYYLAPNWLASLHIPYPGKKKVGQNLHELVSYPGLTLTTQDGNKNTGSIQVEFNPGASQGFDSTDLLKPGTGFESIDLYIQCASPVKRTTRIFCDSRKEVGEGQEYQISLKNQSGKPLTLQCEGQTFFPDQEIRLVSNKVNHWTNLKQTPIINVAEGNEILTLLVGTSEFVENQTSRIFTRNETLFNCFPNPVRETTTIGYSTKQNGNVTITLHDMTGRQVRQLADQYHEAGYHEFTFRKGTLPPGIYFCRMITHADQKSDTAVKVIRIQIF